jgi:hypothetical protein
LLLLVLLFLLLLLFKLFIVVFVVIVVVVPVANRIDDKGVVNLKTRLPCTWQLRICYD